MSNGRNSREDKKSAKEVSRKISCVYRVCLQVNNANHHYDRNSESFKKVDYFPLSAVDIATLGR